MPEAFCLENAVMLAADEALLERYLAGEAVDFAQTMCAAVENGAVPVLCGSSKTGAGCKALLDFLCACVPAAPQQRRGAAGPACSALEHDRGLGKLAHVRVFSGSIEPRQSVYPAPVRRGGKGRGHPQAARPEAGGRAEGRGRRRPRARRAAARGAHARRCRCLTVKAEPEKPRRDHGRSLRGALGACRRGTPTLRFAWIREKREIQLRIVGKIQLEILSALLLERCGLRARFSAPSASFTGKRRRRRARGYADYLAPKPCWAILRFRIEPLPRGSGLVYESKASPARLPVPLPEPRGDRGARGAAAGLTRLGGHRPQGDAARRRAPPRPHAPARLLRLHADGNHGRPAKLRHDAARADPARARRVRPRAGRPGDRPATQRSTVAGKSRF